jgi:hypothetical protein
MLRAVCSAVTLMLVLANALQGSQSILLELRVFNGTEEVTGQTRVLVHRAGDRAEPIAESGGSARVEFKVPEGIYDVQAIQERDGQVVNIQWANRLVVMKYPDEGGRHLEVLNFKNGFGALQVRTPDGSRPDVSLHAGGVRDKEAAPVSAGANYSLFVVPSGTYDVSVRRGERIIRHNGIEVPRDRTRLWLVPDDK